MRFALVATMVLAGMARAADLSGRYYLQNVREMGSELLLKPDGGFELFIAYGAADYWAKGKWQRQEGAVVLNSDSGQPEPPFRMVSSAQISSEGLRLEVVAPGGRGVPNIDVVLQGAAGPVKARTDAEGIARFREGTKPKSVTFQIRVYEFESEPFSLNASHNEFRFEINGREITQIRFADEKLTVDGDALVLRHWGSDQPMRYRKD